MYAVEHNISSAGLHGLDQRQRRSRTSEEVDVRQGQNALGSLSLSTGLTPIVRLWLSVARLVCDRNRRVRSTPKTT